MKNLNESTIEQTLIEMLSLMHGYEYISGPELLPGGSRECRTGPEEVILQSLFRESLKRLNPDVPESARHEAFLRIMNLGSDDIMTNNEAFHTMLCNGVTVEYTRDTQTVGVLVKLIDVENIQNNAFLAVNQFTIKKENTTKRLDVVLFINGLPLVVMELKNPTDEHATLDRAYQQIQNYKSGVPDIFFTNALCVISDGIDARVSSVSAPLSRYLAWKSPIKSEHGVVPEMEVLARYMCEPETLIKLIRYNTVFESEEIKDSKTGLVSVVKIKKVAAYHQYYAVEKAITETVRASHGVDGDRKIGVVWHTQGSGKSLSMVFYAGQLVVHPQMGNPTIIVLTDRNDLDDQLFATFGNCVGLLRQTPVQAESRSHVRDLLRVSGGGIIFTTIQKFSPETGNVHDVLSDRTNIIVVADEAHRSQYGFTGRVVETDDGSEIRYGNAKYLRDALPNAAYIGFTGTPIESDDRSTRGVFGNEIDIYDIKQAVDDGATVPIHYESRLVKIALDEETARNIDSAIDEITDATDEQKENSKKAIAQIDAVIGHPDRLRDVANDIVSHFEARNAVFTGKGMIVCMTRTIAVNLYSEIIKLRPDWHTDDKKTGKIKVVMTSSSDDSESFQRHNTSKQDRKDLALRLKDISDPLNLVIVQSMWLTGFDAPCLHTMYIDKRMRGANLMQAIARVNRVYRDKPSGLIVDYIGIGQDLREALGVYINSGGEGKPVHDIAEIISGMQTKFEIVEQMFHGFDFDRYFTVSNAEKLQVLLAATNWIMRDEKLKNRFTGEVVILSQLYAAAVPSFESEVIRDKVAFFQAVKSRIGKFTPEGGKTNTQVETAIRQIVDEALSSDGVVNIFDAAGIKTPSFGVLSDEFLKEVNQMEQKNLAFELLKKIINDEVNIRKTKNIVQSKRFSEMLADVIKRYHNNQIDTAQVISELSDIAHEMKLEDNRAEEVGLTAEEYAFYTVLSENESTKFLEDVKMKELIHAIVDTVRKNATVDWYKREDARAELRLTVKRILMRYGYPPDLARMEADRVLEQSELMANNEIEI